MTARSRREGWAGRLATVDLASGRGTLEAGQLRVAVALDDLEPIAAAAVGTPVVEGEGQGSGPRAGRRGEFGAETAPRPSRASAGSVPAANRVVPSTLDLRGARVDEALEALDRYLDQAAVAGAQRVTIVHGHGSGALRDAVRATLTGHPLVREWRPGARGEGGDGASVVSL